MGKVGVVSKKQDQKNAALAIICDCLRISETFVDTTTNDKLIALFELEKAVVKECITPLEKPRTSLEIATSSVSICYIPVNKLPIIYGVHHGILKLKDKQIIRECRYFYHNDGAVQLEAFIDVDNRLIEQSVIDSVLSPGSYDLMLRQALRMKKNECDICGGKVTPLHFRVFPKEKKSEFSLEKPDILIICQTCAPYEH